MEPLYATILVVVVTHQKIILAADSRKVTLYPDGTIERETIDKICQKNQCYYAVSGFNATADDSFSIHAILNKVLHDYSDFHQAIKQITTTLVTELKSFFTALKKSSPAFFNSLLHYNSAGGEIVLIKRIEHIPTLYLLEYKIMDGPTIKVRLDTWTTDSTRVKENFTCFWRAIGNTAFLSLQMPHEKEMATKPIAMAKQIIEEGAKRYPDFVGKPITILEMTATEEKRIE
jgi:hypothetical protein